jgi:hypothetical protein
MNPTIKLGSEVMVSDPCYTVGTWCQRKLTDVLPGPYRSFVRQTDDTGGWGRRNSLLSVIHEDYLSEPLTWRALPDDIGVDSGQCGIFSMETYRNDDIFKKEVSEFLKKYNVKSNEDGEEWYGHMCDRTLNEQSWGTYSNGVVSSSGIGDGSYMLSVAKADGKIVGIAVDFFMEKLRKKDYEYYKDNVLV